MNILDPNDEGNMILRNVDNFISNDTASRPWNLESYAKHLQCASFQVYNIAATWKYNLRSCISIVVSTEIRYLETPVLLLNLLKYNFALFRHYKVTEKNTSVVETTSLIHVSSNSIFMHACSRSCCCCCWWWWWSIIQSFCLLLYSISLILLNWIVFKTSL